MNGHDALEKLRAGAELVQIYSGLVYRGPALIGDVLQSIADHDALVPPALDDGGDGSDESKV